MWNIPQSIKTFGSVWDFIWLLYFYFTSCCNILLLFVSNGWENKRSSGLCKRSCWICILFFFFGWTTSLHVWICCFHASLESPCCLPVYHCLDYAELVLLSSETDSKATATAGWHHRSFTTYLRPEEPVVKSFFLEITTYLMTPTAVHGQK